MIKNPRVAVAFAVKRGQLIKPESCPICGSKDNIEGHHEDLSKPLEVAWLCRNCHIELHKSRKTYNTKRKSNINRKRLHFYPDDELMQQVKEESSRSKISVSSWLKLAALEKLQRERRALDEYRERKEGE